MSYRFRGVSCQLSLGMETPQRNVLASNAHGASSEWRNDYYACDQ